MDILAGVGGGILFIAFLILLIPFCAACSILLNLRKIRDATFRIAATMEPSDE